MNKALVEEAQVAQAALEANPQTATMEAREQAESLRFQLARLPESKLAPDEREGHRRELQAKLNQLELKLAEQVALLARMIRERNLTLANVARNLPANGALLDFVQYLRADFTAKSSKTWQKRCYAAYLTFPLAKDSTNIVVERVDLGEAAPIDAAVETITKRMSAGQFAASDLSNALQRVSELVYGPLARHLANVAHLIVCPDGQLSRLPFEMLRHDGRFLLEEKTISYVGSGREIVRLANRSPESKVQGPKSNGGRPKSLVMGNPDFDLDLGSARGPRAVAGGPPATSTNQTLVQHSATNGDETKVSGEPPDTAREPRALPVTKWLSRDYRGLHFDPLPAAEAEARSMAKLLGGGTVLRLGAEAREAELKAVVSPRVLHLATHGFFLSDQEFQRTNSLPDAWSSALTRPGLPKGGTTSDWENPMVRCGIALAGANHAQQITNAVAEDGLLTGLEASLLNLQGTELVILSACQTGAGEVKTGEGVMSLRRAFRIAGAQTVLASQWPVSDAATGRLMTEFMRCWRSGEPRSQAWREAQLSLLHSKTFANPWFWAAFTLTGQWN